MRRKSKKQGRNTLPVFHGKRRHLLIMNFINHCSSCEKPFSFSHPVLPGFNFAHAPTILPLFANMFGVYQTGGDKIWCR
jgi:hypothetical protein